MPSIGIGLNMTLSSNLTFRQSRLTAFISKSPPSYQAWTKESRVGADMALPDEIAMPMVVRCRSDRSADICLVMRSAGFFSPSTLR